MNIGNWYVCFCNFDYAEDPDTHRSVCNGICSLYMKGVPVCWKSKASVTLSSTEAKWITLSEATKEIIFVLQLLKHLGIKVNLLTTVLIDNAGVVFMSKIINTQMLDMVYLRGTGVPQSADNWATRLGRIAPARRAFPVSGTGSRDTVSEARHKLYVPARQLHNMHPMAAGTI